MEVRFENVGKRYGGVHAVKDLTLTIERGGLHFLLGPSGCGKTTTLRMLAGLEQPTSGKILFDGKDVTKLPAAERGIGMVFQNYALWPHMTVKQNVEYGLKLKKLPAQEVQRRLGEVLELTQLGTYIDRHPGQLSGGQQQRVALARALAVRPSVLLLDEPLSNLDAKLRLEMRDNISRIHRETGLTTVYVTHDQKEALSMGTHVSVMRAGLLVQSDTPRRLYHHPRTPFIAGFIGETNLVTGKYLGVEDGLHVVEAVFGRLYSRNAAEGIAVGQQVAASFRPETVRVAFDGKSTPSPNPLRVSLESLTYLGESEQLVLKASGGVLLRATVFDPPEHTLEPGSVVVCHVDADSLLVLPDEADLRSGT